MKNNAVMTLNKKNKILKFYLYNILAAPFSEGSFFELKPVL